MKIYRTDYVQQPETTTFRTFLVLVKFLKHFNIYYSWWKILIYTLYLYIIFYVYVYSLNMSFLKH